MFNWRSDIFDKPFELSYFATESGQQEALKEYDLDKVAFLLSSQGFWNGVVIQRSILTYQQGDPSYFEKSLNLKDFNFFYSYLKYFILNLVLGGKFITVTDENIKNGILNKGIKRLSEKPVLKGGDPSAPFLFYAMKPEENVS